MKGRKEKQRRKGKGGGARQRWRLPCQEAKLCFFFRGGREKREVSNLKTKGKRYVNFSVLYWFLVSVLMTNSIACIFFVYHNSMAC